MQTIPATAICVGDLIDAGNAQPSGGKVHVRAVATVGDSVYVVRRDPGALVPQGYRFRADQSATLYA